MIRRFSNYIPKNIIPIILNEEDIDLVIDEIFIDTDFEKSDPEIETCEPVEKLIILRKMKSVVLLSSMIQTKKK